MCVRGRKTEWKREKEAKDNDINETLPWDINGIFFSGMKEHSNIKLFMRNASSFNSLWSKIFSGNYSAWSSLSRRRRVFSLSPLNDWLAQNYWLLICLYFSDCQIIANDANRQEHPPPSPSSLRISKLNLRIFFVHTITMKNNTLLLN